MTPGPSSECERVLHQPGRVLRVEGDHVVVSAEPAAGCGGCAAARGCAARALAEMRGPRAFELRLAAPGALSPGQPVLIEMPAADFLKAATLALLLPAAALVLAICAAQILALPLLAAIAFCGGAFLAALWPLWRAERRGRLVRNLRVAPGPADGAGA